MELRKYCRRLGLNFPTFSVLTPLPGTDLYEEVKDKLITDNYDHYDFFHTLLPPRLPIKEFYNEFYWLYRKATSLSEGFYFMRKFHLREIPSLITRSYRVLDQIKNAYRDYEK